MPPRRRRRDRPSPIEALNRLKINDAAVQRAIQRLEESQNSIIRRANSEVERQTFTPLELNDVESNANDTKRNEDER